MRKILPRLLLSFCAALSSLFKDESIITFAQCHSSQELRPIRSAALAYKLDLLYLLVSARLFVAESRNSKWSGSEKLAQQLSRSRHWNALLLMDEADVLSVPPKTFSVIVLCRSSSASWKTFKASCSFQLPRSGSLLPLHPLLYRLALSTALTATQCCPVNCVRCTVTFQLARSAISCGRLLRGMSF